MKTQAITFKGTSSMGQSIVGLQGREDKSDRGVFTAIASSMEEIRKSQTKKHFHFDIQNELPCYLTINGKPTQKWEDARKNSDLQGTIMKKVHEIDLGITKRTLRNVAKKVSAWTKAFANKLDKIK